MEYIRSGKRDEMFKKPLCVYICRKWFYASRRKYHNGSVAIYDKMKNVYIYIYPKDFEPVGEYTSPLRVVDIAADPAFKAPSRVAPDAKIIFRENVIVRRVSAHIKQSGTGVDGSKCPEKK